VRLAAQPDSGRHGSPSYVSDSLTAGVRDAVNCDAISSSANSISDCDGRRCTLTHSSDVRAHPDIPAVSIWHGVVSFQRAQAVFVRWPTHARTLGSARRVAMWFERSVSFPCADTADRHVPSERQSCPDDLLASLTPSPSRMGGGFACPEGLTGLRLDTARAPTAHTLRPSHDGPCNQWPGGRYEALRCRLRRAPVPIPARPTPSRVSEAGSGTAVAPPSSPVVPGCV